MKKHTNDFEHDAIPQLVLRLAIPTMLAQLVSVLYSIVDRMYIGIGVGDLALAGVGVCSPIVTLLYSFASLVGLGGSPIMAMRMGEGNQKEARRILNNAFLMLLGLSLVLTVLFWFSKAQLLMWFGASTSTFDYANTYVSIYTAGTVFALISAGMNSFLIAQGFSGLGMATVVLGAVLNIILDPVLIFGLGPFPKLGIDGAALATGIGQTVTLVIYLVIYLLRPIRVKIHVRDLRPNLPMIGRLYAIGIPAVLNMALPSILISTLNAILAPYSPIYILILGVYYKLQTFLYLPANGIVQGMRPIIGFNYGAGEQSRVRKIYRLVLIMTGSIMLVGMIVCMAIPGTLISLFTDNPETIAAGKTALRIISLGFVVSSISVTSSGALEGIGKGVQSLTISLCRYLVIIVPAAFILSRLIGPTGVWHAFWIAEAGAAVISIIVYRKTASAN